MGVRTATCVAVLVGMAFAAPSHAGESESAGSGTGVETLIFFRHGEKPSGDGLGQLTCQGLNRALALPKVLEQFGKPNEIMVPDPAVEIPDEEVKNPPLHYYVRPLATVEPTAIRLGMGVNTKFGYDNVQGVADDLKHSSRAGETIFIAWEHKKMVDIMKQIYSGTVPDWKPDDYDRIDKLTIEWDNGKIKKVDRVPLNEGLHPSTDCPGPAK